MCECKNNFCDEGCYRTVKKKECPGGVKTKELTAGDPTNCLQVIEGFFEEALDDIRDWDE